ncbi:MAG TPA: polysaccharide lyase 6 family protein [Woeseiaceae bacterium]|nr:polysaccharide lyase 6 family protein [Woeseiaceae bacterium]
MIGFRLRLACALALLASCVSQAAEIRVESQQAFRDAVSDLEPGDTVILANGEWRDFEILFTGEGQEGKPITLTAQEKGKVFITGQSNLRLAGAHLVVSGLVFRDGHSPTNTVIAFQRAKGDYAYHSRVTEVVIDRFNNPERYETDYWVMLYGKHNRFDHNHLVGKSNQGVTVAVKLDSEESRANHHRIDHNYFGPRPILGSNGGETLRIGTSHYSLSDSLTVVENNYFDRCDGEVEIISSKSGGNTFRGNLFFESRGTLTLRHGNDNLVENNVFLGNRVEHTGGIRVINKRQTVRNNYMHGLTGHRFGGAFVIMNGVPNSPINRYHQVEDAIIENNSIIESDHIELAAGSDEERSAPPVSTAFRNNLIYNEDGRNVIAVHDDVSGIEFRDNLLNRVEQPKIADGFRSAEIELVEGTNGLLYPSDPELAKVGARPGLRVLRKAETGVDWYPKPAGDARLDTGATVAANPGLDTLVEGVARAKAGDIVVLAPGDYPVSRTMVVDKPVTVRGEGEARITFERTALFEIVEGGSLKLVGLTISGADAPDVAGNAAIRTSRYSMLTNYALVVEGSTIEDLDTNHSFNFFALAKHTFADRIEIRNSTFRNVTGSVLALNREDDDLGIYNGEYITIDSSEFRKIGGAVADIYRGGTDESTFGPHFTLRASTIDDVGNNKRNKSEASIRLHGVQATDIHGNVFVDSRPIRVTETVGEPVTRLSGNTYDGTAEPEILQIGAGR